MRIELNGFADGRWLFPNKAIGYTHLVLQAWSARLNTRPEMLAFVRVPVLSEQITVTDPRVSTVFNDLHSTLFFFMIFAVMVRLQGS